MTLPLAITLGYTTAPDSDQPSFSLLSNQEVSGSNNEKDAPQDESIASGSVPSDSIRLEQDSDLESLDQGQADVIAEKEEVTAAPLSSSSCNDT